MPQPTSDCQSVAATHPASLTIHFCPARGGRGTISLSNAPEDTLCGRLFVLFVSLCYYEYLSKVIREMKKPLSVENGDPEHDKKENIRLESRLKSWFGNTPLYLILQWFDTVEGAKISSKLKAKRRTNEITQRGRLFQRKLGIPDVLCFEYRLHNF